MEALACQRSECSSYIDVLGIREDHGSLSQVVFEESEVPGAQQSPTGGRKRQVVVVAGVSVAQYVISQVVLYLPSHMNLCRYSA